MPNEDLTKSQREGRTILRVSQDLRDWVADAPVDDPDAQSVRRDCDTLDRVGQWLATTLPVTVIGTATPSGGFTAGLSAADPGWHIWTPDETEHRCQICGEGVWGRHRFLSRDR